MGITRLDAVAGLMGLYLIRDQFEDALELPGGAYEIPLMLFDRSFREDGQIYYPVSGMPTLHGCLNTTVAEFWCTGSCFRFCMSSRENIPFAC